MAPAPLLGPLTVIFDYRGQIVENCEFISPKDDYVTVITVKEPSGKFKATAIRNSNNNKCRDALLSSDECDSVQAAIESLHMKSAEACSVYIKSNGHSMPPSLMGGNDVDDDDVSSVGSSSSVARSIFDNVSDDEFVKTPASSSSAEKRSAAAAAASAAKKTSAPTDAHCGKSRKSMITPTAYDCPRCIDANDSSDDDDDDDDNDNIDRPMFRVGGAPGKGVTMPRGHPVPHGHGPPPPGWNGPPPPPIHPGRVGPNRYGQLQFLPGPAHAPSSGPMPPASTHHHPPPPPLPATQHQQHVPSQVTPPPPPPLSNPILSHTAGVSGPGPVPAPAPRPAGMLPPKSAPPPPSNKPEFDVKLTIKWRHHGEQRVLQTVRPSTRALQDTTISYIWSHSHLFDNVTVDPFTQPLYAAIKTAWFGPDAYDLSTWRDASGRDNDDLSRLFAVMAADDNAIPSFEIEVYEDVAMHAAQKWQSRQEFRRDGTARHFAN